MVYLLTKTRGNSSIKGKQKVYFACHPDDFDRYFEEISEDILKTQNCAIYYKDKDQTYDNEELFSDIAEMQLIVVPVTTKLLVKPNNAMDIEVPFAFEKKIPVLPLMQEEGLDELYEKKFGELQYLAKFRRDDTAISFDEKLKKYLESVLIGDELAKKVRAAFRAYIFLSYRKKDRKYAQELMRLIHKNDFCRDIAIWYDEFLTPGENFNDAIAEAMEKSSLFALAVTPSLIEDNNYVMTVEYPEAAKNSKKILPAEMVPTDRTALEEKYNNIPPCINANDGAKLSAALIEQLRDVAEMPTEDDAEHNFFIGLAYLGGIDVESDYERATNLITQAAEAGLWEAMDKLALMYKNGEGVERDFNKSIEWQKKLVCQHKENYMKIKTEAELILLLFALIDLGDNFSRMTGSFADADKCYDEAFELSKQFFEKSELSETDFDISTISDKLGCLAMEQGNYDLAKRYFEKAIQIQIRLTNKIENSVIYRSLSISYNDYGSMYEKMKLWEAAINNYKKSYEIRKKLMEEMETIELYHDFFVICNNIGVVAYEKGDYNEAKKMYKKASETAEKIVEEGGVLKYGRNLAIMYNNIGNVAKIEGDMNTTKRYYKKSLEIIRQLANEIGTMEAIMDLACSFFYVGSVEEEEGNLRLAMGYYERAFEIAEPLVKEIDTVEICKDVAEICNRIITIAKTENNLEVLHRYIKKRQDILSHL